MHKTWYAVFLGGLFAATLAAVLSILLIRNSKRLEAVHRNLHASEKQVRAILNSVSEAIVTIDDKSTMRSANRATTRMFGYEIDEVIGQQFNLLVANGIGPHKTPEENLQSILKSSNDHASEMVGRRKDGSTFPLQLTPGDVLNDDQFIYVAVLRDISERKEAERVKNEFISTVSHELRTPLTSIRGSLGLILGGTAGAVSPQAKQLLGIAYKNTECLKINH